jgi:hypothetical protein
VNSTRGALDENVPPLPSACTASVAAYLALLLVLATNAAIGQAALNGRPVSSAGTIPTFATPRQAGAGQEYAALRGRTLFRGEPLAIPIAIASVGPYLALLDVGSDFKITVLRKLDGVVAWRLGRRGRGPGEFIGPYSLDVAGEEQRTLWVYDLSLRRLTRVQLPERLDQTPTVDSTLLLLSGASILNPIWIGDTVLVALGSFDDGRFGFFGSSGRLLRTTGALPPGDPRVPVPVRQQAYQSSMMANRQRSLLAVATRHASHFVVCRLDGSIVAQAEGDVPFEPRYVVRRGARGPVMGSDLDLRFGYIDLAKSDRYIFALFSGRTREAFPGRATMGEWVHVYDWNARLVRRLRLDGEAGAIAADESGSTLYAIQLEPEPRVRVYSMVGIIPEGPRR